MKLIFILMPFLFISRASSFAQNTTLPFWNEIQDFKKEDSLTPPKKAAILFVGSSSFKNWSDVQDYFPDRTLINRGFGGSSLPDVIRYAGDIIFPYGAKQIVIYCGDNDLAASDTVSAQTVATRFQQLFYLIRRKMPQVAIAFVSIKPSPSRGHLLPKMVQANGMIKQFLKKQRNATFVDIYHPMLAPDGTPKEELFLADRLHMNKKGYALWKKALEPVLLK